MEKNKLTLTIILLFSITGCSLNEQKFNCDGTGLILSKSKAIFGSQEFYFCEKSGVKKMFYTNKKMCGDNTSILGFTNYLIFDEISHTVDIPFLGDVNLPTSIHCKKIENNWFNFKY